jgi:MFS transporter, NNP family, nitrate/nitrite transporter
MTTHTVAARPRIGTVLEIWTPEDKAFWVREGNAIANINLWISIPALLLSFAVWMVWSVVVVNLPNIGFKFSTNQLFWLAALPALCGATLRIFYSFMVPIFGGRRWTAISTASLLFPAMGIGFAVQDPTTSYPTFVALALLCGLGGGNFASSMSNISFFFPKERKGSALGLNAGLGNLGVSVVQFVVPLVITTAVFGGFGGDAQSWVKGSETKQMWLQNAGFIWAPFIVLSTIAAWFGMNDIASAKASFSDQAVIFKRKHNWLMCWLYLGTFGSFIGYSAGFPLLIRSQFPEVNALAWAFLGPLVGAVVRPFGGWLSDKMGGAPVTFWNFIAMTFAVVGVLYFLPKGGGGLTLPFGPAEGNFYAFIVMFMVLFMTTGIGNGSTFRMIPVIFMNERLREVEGRGTAARDEAVRNANKEAAAVLGFSSAIGAYGGFFIPKSYGSSIAMTGGPEAALYLFIAFYITCIVMTWWYYSRKNAEMPC